MSWSVRIEEKNGQCFLERLRICRSLKELAPEWLGRNTGNSVSYSLADLRMSLKVDFADEYIPAAQRSVERAKNCLRDNLESLQEKIHDCPDCKCIVEPQDWSVHDVNKFMAIPLEDVCKVKVSY